MRHGLRRPTGSLPSRASSSIVMQANCFETDATWKTVDGMIGSRTRAGRCRSRAGRRPRRGAPPHRGTGCVPVVPLGEHRVDAAASVGLRGESAGRRRRRVPPERPRSPRAPRSTATVANRARPSERRRRHRAALAPWSSSSISIQARRPMRPERAASVSPTQLWKPYLARTLAPPDRSWRVVDQAGSGGEPRTEHLAAEVARGDARAIGVAQPLHFAGVAGRVEVVAAAVRGEPHRRLDRRAVLTEGREVEIAGALERVGHRSRIVEQCPGDAGTMGRGRKRWGRVSSRSGSTSGGPTSRR